MKSKLKVLMLICAFVVLNAPVKVELNSVEKTQISIVNSVQGQTPPTIEKIKTGVTTATGGLKDAIAAIVGAMLLVSLVIVIWLVASNNPKAKEGVIAWFVAALIYIAAMLMLYN